MNIAIVSNFPYHFECMGFLLELLSKDNNVVVHYKLDFLKYIDYFERIYDFKKIKDGCKKYLDNYDLIIMLSSNDSCFWQEAENKTIGILHARGCEKNVKNFITLWPTVNPNTKNEYLCTFPLYKGLENSPTNTITYVGYFDYFDKDLLNFVENANFTFNFIIYGYKAKTKGEMIKHSNINIINQGISANELIDIINTSKFILCRRWPHQQGHLFSGMYSLGLAHNVPMILQNKVNATKIPCISFDVGYSEVIDKVNNISNEDYTKLKKEMQQFCDLTIQENKVKINNYINKIIK